MYYMLKCHSPFETQPSLLDYNPDRLSDGFLRGWKTGKRFLQSPVEPISIQIDEGESGVLLEYYDATVALMSTRLAKVLTDTGVSNIDFYKAEIHDLETGEMHRDRLAFNLIGAIAAADFAKSKFQADDGYLISVDFDSLAIDDAKTRGALMFRLAESVNGVVVHETVKAAIEAAGINTLTFIPPEEWVG